MKMKVRNKMT